MAKNSNLPKLILPKIFFRKRSAKRMLMIENGSIFSGKNLSSIYLSSFTERNPDHDISARYVLDCVVLENICYRSHQFLTNRNKTVGISWETAREEFKCIFFTPIKYRYFINSIRIIFTECQYEQTL